MEFKDLATKFEGFTADQVCVLAEFGKEILEDNGMFNLSSWLVSLIEDILKTDDIDIEYHKSTINSILHIVDLINSMNQRCWDERKTPFGLTGIKKDNQYVGLDDKTKIIAS